MTLSLREIMLNELYVINQLVENGGELTDELAAMFSITEENLPEKVDGYKNVIDRLVAEVELLKERAKQFSSMAAVLTNTEKKLKDHLKEYMIKTEKKEICGHDWRYIRTPTKSVEIYNEDNLPAAFVREVITHEPDKILIEAAISSGQEVDGAKIVHGSALRVYPNTKNAEKPKGKKK